MINLGTINADTASNTIVVQGSSVTNDGALTATAATLDVNNLVNNLAGHIGSVSATGGTLDLDGTYTIDQLPVTDATLALRGDWNNTGSIDATNSRLRLHGNFTVAKLGTFNRIGPDNRADIIGTLTNAAATLTLDADTDWTLEGGRINGGTVAGDGTLRVTSDSTLDGVTLDADVALTSYTCCAHSYLRIENGLTLNSQLTMTQSDSFDFSTILEVAGNQTISGSGTIQFAQQGSRRNTSVSNYIYSKSPGETLTIGSGITIQGKGGFVGRSNAALINLGTINADTASNTIVVQGSSVTNDGTLTATAATLDVNNLTNNVGTALATGGTLDLDGTYTIDQSLPVTDATLALRGDWNNTGIDRCHQQQVTSAR